MIGQIISHYKILEKLGEGGMGVVYKARDTRLDRTVALKFIASRALRSEEERTRIVREARAAASLNHPNIATVYEIDETDDYTYIAMEYIEGDALDAKIAAGTVSVSEAVDIAAQIAEGLQVAHEQGIIHRDIKSSNVIVSKKGKAKLVDFGLVKMREVSLVTKEGTTLGTVPYMSPEQARGEEVDHRTDIWSLGVVLYEMLAGKRPFQSEYEQALIYLILNEEPQPLKKHIPNISSDTARIVKRALEKDKEDRYASAAEMLHDLTNYTESLKQNTGGSVDMRAMLHTFRKPQVAIPATLVILAFIVLAFWYADRQSNISWAREQAIPEVERLAEEGSYAAALSLALEVEKVTPDDPTLARLWPRFSVTAPVRSEPPGASVYRQPMEDPNGEWEYLGEAPLEAVRFAGRSLELEGYSGPLILEDDPARFRFELEGYRGLELLQTAILGVGWRDIMPLDPVRLTRDGSLPEGMVRIPGFTHESVTYGDYFMDRHEVTNREFQEFVDAGGYRDPEYWVEPIVQGSRELEFKEAMALFTDQTGRTGPATWRLGTYADGQGYYPVGGVSWYEAAAFARWAGKELPTTMHWRQALRYYRENSHLIVPGSNLEGDGSRPVGWDGAMSTLGLYDMVGNVREWCYNPVPDQGRATIGGAWTDAPFHVGWTIPKDPLDRDETHGFRLVRTFDEDILVDRLRRPVQRTEERDYRAETPASDMEYEIYKRFYKYDPIPLNAAVEQADTFDLWVREKVTFDLPYGERGGAYLYLPKDRPRPLQAVIYWGGSNVLTTSDVDKEFIADIEFLVRGGRAVAQPIWKGAFHRDNSPTGTTHGSWDWESRAYRDVTIQWMQDLSSTIDYLEKRPDIDEETLGYYGLSWGGAEGPRVLALERRIGAAVLNVGGLQTRLRFLPEIDPFNFVTRVETPVLMINGEYDIVFPYETSQLPMFELLGTNPEDKEHYVAPAAHLVPRDKVIRETLGWLDRYLGPVRWRESE
jgi:eukaryotic-like serine/threonine-protein kinase